MERLGSRRERCDSREDFNNGKVEKDVPVAF